MLDENFKKLNNFELLCLLAATHDWCWNITCSTCGHYYFKNCLKLLIYNPSILKEVIILKSKYDIENNEILGIVGESGSGKSTLIKSIMR